MAKGSRIESAPAAPLASSGTNGSSSQSAAFGGGGSSAAVLPPPDQEVKPFPIESAEKPSGRRNVKDTSVEDEDDEQTDDEAAADAKPSGKQPDAEADDSDDAPEAEESIDADLLKQALAMDFTEDDIQELGSNAALRRVIAAEDRRQAKLFGNQRKTQQQQAPQQTAPAPQVQQVQKQQATVAAQIKKLELKLSKDNHDPEALEAFEALREKSDRLEAELTALRESSGDLDKLIKHVGQMTHERRVERFDSAVSRLPEEFKELLGEGSSLDDFDQKSEQFKRRDEIFDTADNLIGSYVQRGQQPPSYQKAVEKAAYAVLSNKVKSLARSESERERKLAIREKQLYIAPTHRQAPEKGPLTQDQELSQMLKTFRREHRVRD